MVHIAIVGTFYRRDRSVLEPVDIPEILAPHPPRTNFNIFRVDDRYAIRVARIKGEYPWHFHPDHDEAWVILKGSARIRTEEDSVELGPLNAVLVPKGTRHSPLALEDETTVLIVNAREFTTSYLGDESDHTAGYTEFDVH